MMRFNSMSSSSTILLLFAGIVIFAAVHVHSRDLDCRRFVFAPMCRGATIKRSFIPNIGVNQDDVHELLLDYPKQQVMDAETQPLLIPILIDRRIFEARSAANRHQPQLDAED
ncbi:hypothetical protein DAPPUDRAFT_303013 [Daphnia pulex]|uniref:Uncharacterized protein n=1 Tax=Daphnia pulex TaxID=6669 RepID=E9FTB5_DAPPU|nr:hypothetical protein DAPPUDRAFT_303013 [Daphnia pulex]|eukprot:EFX89671.1 hypothetical protein DAPPUDRAFT_303013 [Daphnia pulex]